MNHLFPIYTASTECHDCHKCVRQCPVKAIKIQKSKAEVLPDLCVACGQCVELCPTAAKNYRNDINRVKNLIKQDNKVIAAIAPSFSREFRHVEQNSIVSALKKLGFFGVSEVALGADVLSRDIAEELNSNVEPKLVISTACPAAVENISKYYSHFKPYLSKHLSPAQIHAKMIKKQFGEDTSVVFIGPCTAKKLESDNNPELIDIALTFTELREWFEAEGVLIERCKPFEPFLLGRAGESKLYPLETGMVKTLQPLAPNTNYLTIAGIDEINNALECFTPKLSRERKKNTFIEVLACKGSCINGPCLSKSTSSIHAEINILNEVDDLTSVRPCSIELDKSEIIRDDFSQVVPQRVFKDQEIEEVLHKIDKFGIEEELNCGGCGYQKCRSFASAIIEGKAEPAMCISYLRKRAQQKASAIMHYIPAGLVLVDSKMRVIECNAPFAEIFKDELQEIIEIDPKLKGVKISKVIPIEDKFSRQLNGQNVISSTVNYDNKILDIHIFPITPGEVIGGFFQDITNTEMRHEEIADLAKTVIKKNLNTVQEIACRLGENMAETEILLRTISRGFSSEKVKKFREEKRK